ncbi:hypothetical protein EO95_10585 [Methanosarcina sp. 1.H.T.1A.1]|uniref:glycosyltransferase family 2 protein n=1 Tax=Methanosarcina sp. 1.H.T.1A.1 TaxID=1483602 RepID=UPI000620EBC3|nr:glycosyltransferase [Methanosarcina sp. 1.H.T.1A.1]KKH96470.1 hypothetical protein EO95_10585 [Methanosarcina sp. 1.H.T.1A.1]
MSDMNVSIIIPTYKRSHDLKECLDSIFIQTKFPSEIIVVDNADDFETEKIVSVEKVFFENKGAIIKYIKNGKLNSANIARNIGADNAKNDLLLFVDDDVVLDPNFIKEILNAFSQYPNAIGVQGYIQNMEVNPLIDIIERVFFLKHSRKNRNQLLSSFQDVYAYPLTKIVSCQWLMAGCTCYIKDVFDKFKFDEYLYKYCAGDDADLSFRINKMYPGTLYQTPFAKLIHKVSSSGRPAKKEIIFTTQVYHTYLFFKNIDQNILNKCMFVWSRIGLIMTKVGVFFLKPSQNNLLYIKYLFGAYLYCLKNLKYLKDGEIAFYTSNL